MKSCKAILVFTSIILAGYMTTASAEFGALSETTARISVNTNGAQGNRNSQNSAISTNARFVAFLSAANNLVPGDNNNIDDVFLHDRRTGKVTRVSVDSKGNQGNRHSHGSPSISADGRIVAFSSSANNLVPGDTNNESDIFVHDSQTGTTTRVSVDSDGNQGNGGYHGTPSVSADGRFIAFEAMASNLVVGDTNGVQDIFIHDRQTGETTRVSVDDDGKEGNGSSIFPSLSADGYFIAFRSSANNLVPGDTNDEGDVFIYNRLTGSTTRVSIDSNGNEANASSSDYQPPSISLGGRFIVFDSGASNLVPGDTNEADDVFVHNLQTNETTRASIDSDGNQGNGSSNHATISFDGRFIAFESLASNLVPEGDSNEHSDVFVHDRQAGITTIKSTGGNGNQGNGDSGRPSTSVMGFAIAFESFASNLVPGDTNSEIDVFVHDRMIGKSTHVIKGAELQGDTTPENRLSVQDPIQGQSPKYLCARMCHGLSDVRDLWWRCMSFCRKHGPNR